MKFYRFLLFALITLSCKGQTNELTASEFNSLKVNNVLLNDIINTHGNENSIKSLLDPTLQVTTGVEPDYWIEFSSTKYMLLFQDGKVTSPGVVSDYQLTDFLIKDGSAVFNIKGVDIKLGDNISNLGSVNILTYSDGRKEIVYKIGVQVIEIGFDDNTNLITKIKYKCYNI